MGTGFRLAPFYNFIVLSGVFYDDAMEKDGGEDSLLCSDEEYSLEAKINAWPSWSGRISRKNDTGGRPSNRQGGRLFYVCVGQSPWLIASFVYFRR